MMDRVRDASCPTPSWPRAVVGVSYGERRSRPLARDSLLANAMFRYGRLQIANGTSTPGRALAGAPRGRRDVMKRISEIRKIAFLGDYLPRKCGIATFTHDLCSSVARAYPGTDCFVVPVNDIPQGYDYPPEVRFEIQERDLDSYLRAADFLNFNNTDLV